MKIIIAGAGDVGLHLAKLLSYESQDITIIDSSIEKLNYTQNNIDVIAIKGDATSIEILQNSGVADTDLLIAVTDSPNTNITIGVIGKKLGAKKTIVRIENSEFLTTDKINFTELGIDSMISPEMLAAKEIQMLLKRSPFNDIFNFEDEAITLIGTTLDSKSPIENLSVIEVAKKFPDTEFIPIAINRLGETHTIIPRGNTIFKRNDQVYITSTGENANKIYDLTGKIKTQIKRVMILGGGKIGFKTAKHLENDGLSVKLIEKNKHRAFFLADELQNTLVINGDGRDVKLLEEENIREMDAFVAITGDSETNIMSCLVAKSRGVEKTIALVENMDYIHLSQTIGIDTLINKKLLAASSIFKYIRKGEVLEIANLHNVEAEVLELEIKDNTKITEKPIKDLNFPRKAIIGGVIRDGKGIIPLGDFQIQKHDKVVIFCLPETVSEVEKFF